MNCPCAASQHILGSRANWVVGLHNQCLLSYILGSSSSPNLFSLIANPPLPRPPLTRHPSASSDDWEHSNAQMRPRRSRATGSSSGRMARGGLQQRLASGLGLQTRMSASSEDLVQLSRTIPAGWHEIKCEEERDLTNQTLADRGYNLKFGDSLVSRMTAAACLRHVWPWLLRVSRRSYLLTCAKNQQCQIFIKKLFTLYPYC